jgi:hypothetical protein
LMSLLPQLLKFLRTARPRQLNPPKTDRFRCCGKAGSPARLLPGRAFIDSAPRFRYRTVDIGTPEFYFPASSLQRSLPL